MNKFQSFMNRRVRGVFGQPGSSGIPMQDAKLQRVADETAIPRPTLSRAAHGNNGPSLETLRKMVRSKIFGAETLVAVDLLPEEKLPKGFIQLVDDVVQGKITQEQFDRMVGISQALAPSEREEAEAKVEA